MQEYYVYGLYDGNNNEPFYIGKGKENRLNYHTIAAIGGYHTNKHVARKICKIIREGRSVRAEKLYCNLSEDSAFDLEVQTISDFNKRNVKLCNLTSGGEGISGATLSKSTKRKISKSMTGKKFTNSHREEISKALKRNFDKKLHSKEFREKMLKVFAGYELPTHLKNIFEKDLQKAI